MSRKRTVINLIAMISFLFITGCAKSNDPQDTVPTLLIEQPTPTIIPTLESSIEINSPSFNKTNLLIYDDDGSRDGMVALLYLLSIPEISIEAVNISYGEAHPEQYIQLVGQALEYVGIQNIPLGAGKDAPLGNGTPFPDWLRQLSEVFWDYPLPDEETEFDSKLASELIIEEINNNTEPVTIFLSGTFTNLAQALRNEPQIKDNIAAVYFMGGAVYGPGNIRNLVPDSKNQVAEWNIIADPLAAKEVFEAGLEMYMIPLDATNQVIHVQEELNPWRLGDQKAALAADLYDIMFDQYGLDQVEIFDLTAAVIMENPELCNFESFSIGVITDEGENQGQTVIIPDGEPNMYVCLDPDVDKVKKEIDEVFTSSQVSAIAPKIDVLFGRWSGTAMNNKGVELQVEITIDKSCQLGMDCGEFNISNGSCSGRFLWVGMEGELFKFQARNKTSGCGEGDDFLVPQDDGTVLYISRGNYGETKGILNSES